jgi:hypothetical protein
MSLRSGRRLRAGDVAGVVVAITCHADHPAWRPTVRPFLIRGAARLLD